MLVNDLNFFEFWDLSIFNVYAVIHTIQCRANQINDLDLNPCHTCEMTDQDTTWPWSSYKENVTEVADHENPSKVSSTQEVKHFSNNLIYDVFKNAISHLNPNLFYMVAEMVPLFGGVLEI